MRLIGGRLKGRPLATPKDDRIRPTTDRVREALFNILEHGIEDFEIDGAQVLDLFAGTGALGIEALSRGAVHAVFVENDRQHLPAPDAPAVVREPGAYVHDGARRQLLVADFKVSTL